MERGVSDPNKVFLLAIFVVFAASAGAVIPVPFAADSDSEVNTGTEAPTAISETTPTSTPIETPTETPTVETSTPTETATPEPEVDPDNPYRKETLTVYINESLTDRDMTPLVRGALDYWEANAETHAGYNISYRIIDEESTADVHVKFEPVEECGLTAPVDGEYLGCADLVEDQAPDTANVIVSNKTSNPITKETLIHEIGHTLGLDHDDEPQQYMRHSVGVFDSQPTKIHLRSEHGNFPKTIEREVAKALDFFTDHTDLNWKFVDSPEEAHVIVHYDSYGDSCGFDRGGSCTGEGDYQNQVQITLSGLDSSVVAWHVGYIIAPEFFDERPDDLEPDADRDTREGWP